MDPATFQLKNSPSSLVHCIETDVHCPGPDLDLPDDLDHLVGVEQLQAFHGILAAVFFFVGAQALVPLRLEDPVGPDHHHGCYGLALEVGHALGLAPSVEIAPPFVDGTLVEDQEAATKSGKIVDFSGIKSAQELLQLSLSSLQNR